MMSSISEIQHILNDRLFSGYMIGTTQALQEWVWVLLEFEGKAQDVMGKCGGH